MASAPPPGDRPAKPAGRAKPATVTAAPRAAPRPGAERPEAGVERVVGASYAHIRWAFWLSLAIAALLFLLGALLLGLAAWNALRDDDLSRGTILVAALGLAALVILFVARPWADAAEHLADAQQVHIVAASYLAGSALADRHDSEALGLLTQLTATSVALLEDGQEPLPESKLSALQAAVGVRRQSAPTD
jgi:hypothetical protein